MTDRRLNWGILSTANIGRVAVIPAIQASTNGTVVVVGSRDSATAKTFADKAGIPEHAGSYQAVLDDPSVEAVYIPLPNSLHREWTIKAAERGKHVLCEKPLGLTAAECHDMAAAASANGVALMEAFMYRFHPRTEAVVRAVREGTIGELRTIRSAFTFRLTKPNNIRLDRSLGGGALMDVGCYCVNVSRTLAGGEPETVEATANVGPTGVDLELAGLLHFPRGVTAMFECALTAERQEWYEVAGTEGAIRVPAAFLPGAADAVIDRSIGGRPPEAQVVPGADEYRCMVEHFAESVVEARPIRYSAAEAAANMRVIEALYQSAREGGRQVPLA
ncbi:MAG: Gfo/Idh/MocA family protein [Gemmatimonadales bacterium]